MIKIILQNHLFKHTESKFLALTHTHIHTTKAGIEKLQTIIVIDLQLIDSQLRFTGTLSRNSSTNCHGKSQSWEPNQFMSLITYYSEEIIADTTQLKITSTNTNRSENTNMSQRPAPARVTWAPDSEAGSSHWGVNGLQRRPLCHNPLMLPKCSYLLTAFHFSQFVWRMHSPNSHNRGVCGGGLCPQGNIMDFSHNCCVIQCHHLLSKSCTIFKQHCGPCLKYFSLCVLFHS